jgi:hypothetical protein
MASNPRDSNREMTTKKRGKEQKTRERERDIQKVRTGLKL